jgi:hypothetical protein
MKFQNEQIQAITDLFLKFLVVILIAGLMFCAAVIYTILCK